MAYRGQVIENPISGERITFVTTAADTGGELLVIELELAPDGHAPGLHVHPILEERFEVVSGRIRFRQGLRSKVAGPGDVVVVTPGTVHAFSNAGDEPARARVEIRPALRMERLLETAVALAREGRTSSKGMPTPSSSPSSRASSPTRSAGPRPRLAAARDARPAGLAGGAARARRSLRRAARTA